MLIDIASKQNFISHSSGPTLKRAPGVMAANIRDIALRVKAAGGRISTNKVSNSTQLYLQQGSLDVTELVTSYFGKETKVDSLDVLFGSNKPVVKVGRLNLDLNNARYFLGTFKIGPFDLCVFKERLYFIRQIKEKTTRIIVFKLI